MWLHDLEHALEGDIYSDGEFDTTGMIGYESSRMLVFLESEAFLEALQRNGHVSCVITTRALGISLSGRYGTVISEDPKKAFYLIHNYLCAHTKFYGDDHALEISPDARIHPAAYIDDKNVRIEAGVIIEPHATILAGSFLEKNVIVRAGALVGCQGYEFKHFGESILPVAHAGGVLIHSNVEIQGNAVVDKAVFGGYTEIGEETKIDNLVHIAHNVRIGKRTRVVASSVIGGSSVIGDDVWIGPGSVISNGIRIGSGAYISLGSVVTQDVPSGARVTGNFAVDHRRFISFIKSIR